MFIFCSDLPSEFMGPVFLIAFAVGFARGVKDVIDGKY